METKTGVPLQYGATLCRLCNSAQDVRKRNSANHITRFRKACLRDQNQHGLLMRPGFLGFLPRLRHRLLHTISNGNPGWINTFLLCLRQSGLLRIKRMGYSAAQADGYVFCESSFLHRDSIKSSSTLRPSLSEWRLFESSFDSGDPLLYPGEETPSLFNKIVDVAYLAGPVDTKDYYTSRNLEAFHLMLYDSLSAFEQLVCKCAAFLGQKFLRASLMYTMATESEWEVAIGK